MQNQTYHLKINKTSIKCQTNELISSSVVVWMPHRSFSHWEILKNIRILLINSLQQISSLNYKGLGPMISKHYSKLCHIWKIPWQSKQYLTKHFQPWLRLQRFRHFLKNPDSLQSTYCLYLHKKYFLINQSSK